MDEWRDEVASRPNLDKDEINRAQLSAATITGWKISCELLKHIYLLTWLTFCDVVDLCFDLGSYLKLT